jgi:hypothetical protein
MTKWIRLVVVASLLAVAGCATTTLDLSNLNASYETLLARKYAPSARADGPTDLSVDTERQEIANGLDAVGTGALDASKKNVETPTKIAALRLAAVAYWQANEPEKSASAKVAGLQLCTDKAAGAPRDCALLAYIDILAAQKQLHAQQKPLLLGKPTPDALAQMDALINGLEALGRMQLEPLKNIVSGAPPYTGIGAGSQAYFRKVAAVSACMLSTADFWARNATPGVANPARDDLLAKAARVARDPYGLLLFTAGKITRPDQDWWTQGAECLP